MKYINGQYLKMHCSMLCHTYILSVCVYSIQKPIIWMIYLWQFSSAMNLYSPHSTMKWHNGIFEWNSIWHMGNEWARFWIWWEEISGGLLFSLFFFSTFRFDSLKRNSTSLKKTKISTVFCCWSFSSFFVITKASIYRHRHRHAMRIHIYTIYSFGCRKNDSNEVQYNNPWSN